MSASGPTATLALPSTPAAAAQARDFVSGHATDLGRAVVADAELLVTELVSNALRYGAPEIVVSVSRRVDGLEVAVKDDGPTLPALPATAPGSRVGRGRGLLIVDAVARQWGVRPESQAAGKTVWFALA